MNELEIVLAAIAYVNDTDQVNLPYVDECIRDLSELERNDIIDMISTDEDDRNTIRELSLEEIRECFAPELEAAIEWIEDGEIKLILEN